ncbi:hypothetical protein [Streptomyces sp. CT34]|uniref:hypothetical protein n=1 Tax=Streptomyces sp. CT34 TaxID=1553907 RepID=UPI000AF5E24C|nr:hypothetical protein [Streptomyces sp. CT34]
MAPSLLAALCLGSHPTAGWLALGGFFAVAGMLMPMVVRRVPGASAVDHPDRHVR